MTRAERRARPVPSDLPAVFPVDAHIADLESLLRRTLGEDVGLKELDPDGTGDHTRLLALGAPARVDRLGPGETGRYLRPSRFAP